MAGRTGAATIEAMKMVLAGVTPYKAIQRTQIAPSTMYRNSLYKLWLRSKEARLTDTALADKLLAQLRQELDVTRPKPRISKREKFLATSGES